MDTKKQVSAAEARDPQVIHYSVNGEPLHVDWRTQTAGPGQAPGILLGPPGRRAARRCEYSPRCGRAALAKSVTADPSGRR
jgi:hypothetical protein